MRVDIKALADERLLYAGVPGGNAKGGPLTERSTHGVSTVADLKPVSVAHGLPALVTVAAATEIERGVPFRLAPVFMGAGAAVYFVAAHEPDWSTVITALGVTVLAAWLARHNEIPRLLLVALLMALAGVCAAKFEVSRAATTITGSPVATTVTGRVARIENRANGRIRLTLDVIGTERPVLRYAPERVRLTARAVPAGVEPGSIVVGYARLMSPSGPVRPGGYDFAFESYFDRIGAIGFYLGDPELVEASAQAPPGQSVAAWIEGARLGIAERVRTHISGDQGEIAAALIAGVRSGIPEPVNEALRRTGLAHILAISGLHMALVAATILVSIRSLAALFPNLVARYPVKKYAAAAALLVCALYLAISGAAVAAQRSFIMLAVMLVALLFDRAALTLRNLAIAAMIILAVAPHEIMGPSFQMSFAATAALIGGYAMWSERNAHRQNSRAYRDRGMLGMAGGRVLKIVTGLAATSIIAGLATTVYGVYHFNRVSPLALGANMLAMPLVTFCVMPMAVLSMALMPIGLDWLPLAAMDWGLRGVLAVAQWFSDRTTVDAVGTMPPAALLAFTLALACAALLTTWLRIAAIPFLALGLLLQFDRALPDVLVSEDARLVAVRTANGQLAVNRTRPNAFTIQDWLRAQGATDWLKPREADTGQGYDVDTTSTFECQENTCTAELHDGGSVVHTDDAAIAATYCGSASLIVLTDATARSVCQRNQAFVVTARDMARKGSLAVFLDPPVNPTTAGSGIPTAGHPTATLETHHAIAEPYRPWHAHRQFSREARGMPPYRRSSSDDD